MRKIARVSVPVILMIGGVLAFATQATASNEVIPITRPGDEAMTCADIDAEGQELNRVLDAIQDHIRYVEVSDAPARAAASAGTGLMLFEMLGNVLGISAGGAVSAANIATSKAAAETMRADADRQHQALERRMDAALDRMDRLGELYQAKCN